MDEDNGSPVKVYHQKKLELSSETSLIFMQMFINL